MAEVARFKKNDYYFVTGDEYTFEDMNNLLEETIRVIESNGQSVDSVRWVGSKDVWFSWEHFVSIANVKYDQGYGSAEVAGDLIVVGDNWWLERFEYDGSEEWIFKENPTQPEVNLDVFSVVQSGSIGWPSLEDLNEFQFRRADVGKKSKKKKKESNEGILVIKIG